MSSNATKFSGSTDSTSAGRYTDTMCVAPMSINGFAGTSIAGMGFGAGFQGAVRSIVPFAAPHERAGVLSIVFIVSYLSMGVPAIVAGALVARHGNILSTGKEFGVVIMTLALAAVIGAGLRMATTSSPG